MNVLLCCALLGALQDASARGDRVPPGTPSSSEMLENEIAAQSESVVVKLVSREGDPPAFDVVAHGAPAHEVLARLAQAAGRALKLDSNHRYAHEYLGELYLDMNQPDNAEKQLAALKKACPFIGKCEEFEDLKKAIDAYKAKKK